MLLFFASVMPSSVNAAHDAAVMKFQYEVLYDDYVQVFNTLYDDNNNVIFRLLFSFFFFKHSFKIIDRTKFLHLNEHFSPRVFKPRLLFYY